MPVNGIAPLSQCPGIFDSHFQMSLQIIPETFKHPVLIKPQSAGRLFFRNIPLGTGPVYFNGVHSVHKDITINYVLSVCFVQFCFDGFVHKTYRVAVLTQNRIFKTSCYSHGTSQSVFKSGNDSRTVYQGKEHCIKLLSMSFSYKPFIFHDPVSLCYAYGIRNHIVRCQQGISFIRCEPHVVFQFSDSVRSGRGVKFCNCRSQGFRLGEVIACCGGIYPLWKNKGIVGMLLTQEIRSVVICDVVIAFFLSIEKRKPFIR